MKGLFDNKFFKFFYTLFRICFVLIIVLYLSFIIVQRLSGNKSIFGYRLFNVATGSMIGVYDINDVIAVKDCDVKKLKVGDDVAYRGNRGGLDGLLITHRIIKIEEKEDGSRIFTTQGVNAPVSDPTIGEDQILGKVVGIVPVITQLNHIVKSQAGFFLLVFCPLVLVIVLEVLQTITEIRLEKNEIQRVEKKISDKKNKKEEKKSKNEEDLKEEKAEKKEEKKEESIEKEDSSKEKKEKEEIEELPEILSSFDNTRELPAQIREKIEMAKEDDKLTDTYIHAPSIEEDKEKREDIELL